MATLQLKSLVKDITKCAICLDYYIDPRSLPCLHTFCLECMQGHCRDKCPEDDAECPVCRREFQIPVIGVEGLQHNFFVADLVSIKKLTSTTQDGNSAVSEGCGVCGDETRNKANFYCVDCDEKLCDHCCIRCRKWKGGAHQLKKIFEEKKSELTQQNRSFYCEQHSSEKLTKFCTECNINICPTCIAVTNHRRHNLIEISKAALQFKNHIEEHLSRLSNFIDKVKKKRQSIEEANDKNFTYAEVTSVEHPTGKTFKPAYRPTNKSMSEKEVLGSLESIDLALVAMESFINYAAELLNKGTHLDITGAADSLNARVNELFNMASNLLEDSSPSKNKPRSGGLIKYFRNLFARSTVGTDQTAHVTERKATLESRSYEEVDICETTRTPDNCGADACTIESTLSSSVNQPSVDCDCEARLLYSNSAFTGIRGVTHCDNKLFVVCEESDTMLVSQLGSGLFTPVRIEGLRDPCDIVACSETKQLFIGDCKHSGIFRLSIDGQIKQWMSTEPVRPRTLSVKASRILLCMAIGPGKLFLYGSHGNLLRTVTLTDISVICHAVETFVGTFIVGHIKPQPQISEVNVDGQTIREYNNKQHMILVHYLSTDIDGRVIVADSKKESYTILLLNRDLEFERVILDDEKHALVRPRKICYIEHTRQLIVRSEECIEVFDISQVMLCTHGKIRPTQPSYTHL